MGVLWARPPALAALQARSAGAMVEHLGIVFTEIGDDFLCASMPVDKRRKQPAGLLHCGASLALAESLGSIASLLCLDGGDKMPVGIEINANHLKSVIEGSVTGKVTPIRIGKNLHVWNIEISNDDGELTCVSRLTVMIVPRR